MRKKKKKKKQLGPGLIRKSRKECYDAKSSQAATGASEEKNWWTFEGKFLEKKIAGKTQKSKASAKSLTERHGATRKTDRLVCVGEIRNRLMAP